MTDEQALAHQIIKQAEHDPANVMMLGEVKPLAEAYVELMAVLTAVDTWGIETFSKYAWATTEPGVTVRRTLVEGKNHDRRTGTRSHK